MSGQNKAKWFILAGIVICLILVAGKSAVNESVFSLLPVKADSKREEKDFIKWVDFNATYPALEKAMKLDIETYESEIHIKWTDVLAWLSCKYGNNFKQYKARDIDTLAEKLRGGQRIEDLTRDMKFFPYYQECYEAALGEFLGEYKIELPDADSGEKKWIEAYGLKAFSPIAEGYWYEHYDDFGVGRSYGYQRRHLGHDLIIGTGAPVVAVESGIVENIGWNQYGGWRIGIRSFDGKRYYYYAHLRKDRPYATTLYQGKSVNAGDVIGYSGRTGYSKTENVNNIDTPHLHYGMQLIFDESQREGPKEIWIDLYHISKLLAKNRSTVIKDEQTKEYIRKYQFSEPNYYLRNSTIHVSAGSVAPEGSLPVPIIMYHSLLKDPASHNSFIISPSIFESDLQYLKDHGYQTILLSDLISYVKHGTPLPEKPVLLTFDDGHYNNYAYAYPLLEKYDMKAVISIVGKLTDQASELNENNPSYSYLTWDHVKEMADSGRVEIQNHSFDLHNYNNGRHGAAICRGESVQIYEEVLKTDIELLQHKIVKATGAFPVAFTYPFGELSKESELILKSTGFEATLGCRKGVNYILPDADATDQLFNLRRNLRPPYTPSGLFFQDICP